MYCGVCSGSAGPVSVHTAVWGEMGASVLLPLLIAAATNLQRDGPAQVDWQHQSSSRLYIFSSSSLSSRLLPCSSDSSADPCSPAFAPLGSLDEEPWDGG